MPVLTCPFNMISKKEIPKETINYPNQTKISTELTIKPTAGETWGVEGLSLQFTATYIELYYENVTQSLKSLNEQIKVLEEVAKFYSEVAVIEQHKWEKEGGTGLAPGNGTNVAAQRAAESERKNLEKEIQDLGLTQTREGLGIPPLVISARLYARQNELIWADNLTPLRFRALEGHFFAKTKNGETVREEAAFWNESIDTHIQFDDPIDITERENLTLVLVFSGPPTVISSETLELLHEGGPEIGEEGTPRKNLNISDIQAVVNYGRTVAGEKE